MRTGGPDVVVMADAAPADGLGHLSRSGAVAAALRARDLDVACFAFGRTSSVRRDGALWEPATSLAGLPRPGSGRLLIVDSYKVSCEEARAWLGDGASLVAMHPRGSEGFADAIISPIPSSPQLRAPVVLEGLEYACLRPVFWGVTPSEPTSGQPLRVLIAAGGADGAIALAAAESVRRAVPTAALTVVRGPHARWSSPPTGTDVLSAPDSLAAALSDSQIVVTAAGQTALEALAMGRPAVVFVAAENQRRQAQYLTTRDLVISTQDASDIGGPVADLARDLPRQRDLASRGRQAVDGFGALRVAHALASIVGV